MSSIEATTSWDDFERRASWAIPAQPLKPKRCWVGVLLHHVDPRRQLTELDFIWMIGHSKITLEKIHETYEQRLEFTNFDLVSRNGVLDYTKTLKDFMTAGSELIVFKAVPTARLLQISPTTRLQTPNGPPHSITATASLAPLTASVKPEPQDANALVAQEFHDVRDLTRPQMPIIAAAQSPPTSPLPRRPRHDTSRHPVRSVSTDRHLHSPKLQHARQIAELPADQTHPPPNVTHQASGDPMQRTDITSGITHDPTIIVRRTPTCHGGVPGAPPHPLSHVHPHNAPLAGPMSTNPAQPSSPEQQTCEIPVFHNKVVEPSQPFDPNNFFKREPSPLGDVQEESGPIDSSLRDIIKQEDPEVHEAAVSEALKVLEGLKEVFVQHAAASPDAQAWVESIDRLVPQAKRRRTVVGVVGNTGAGKSSVINALLDEERLVPTNCMRACTAVVTEISWNDSNDPFSRYRAEIEFISPEDWEKEVATLMKEFLNENGTLSRDVSDQNSDAGIAWAKFHAVYPKIARDSLDKCTVPGLMDERGLSVLGTTKMINTAQPFRFYSELQKYVDSKEKVTKKDKDKNTEKQSKTFEMEYWPLIKVVKIYTKADALSTGAVIVDLSGVHDSNAARAAVAQGYIKQCTGLWIVAPITRAVDDKAAKTLLGDSFKTQLKYDGGFSNVTFICSKTDDISITEAIDTLELEDEVARLYEQEQELKQEIEATKARIQDLQESKDVYMLAQREIGGEIEVWEELQDQLDGGKEVFAPPPKTVKRKKKTTARRSRKKHQADDEGSDADFIVSDDEASETEDEDEQDQIEEVRAPRLPLTEEDIKAKLKALKEAKKSARREGLEIKPKIDELKPQIREAEAKIKAIKAEISRICISGRNEYSKRAIQQDFAAGIKELDQENAAEEDEENFNPDEELRDYDEVAKALPVFCVSSRAYQKMCGRLRKDDAVPGFDSPEETEMPQLQAHCKKITEAGRMQSARNFLLSVCQQLTTFCLWASNNGSGVKMTDDDKRRQVRYVERRLSELEKGLEGAVDACLNAMKRELNDQIFDKYPDLIQEAINAAPETVQRWGVHRADGGLAWSTYKAVVRRNGTYQSPTAGHRDFNYELVDPIVKKLATGWERAFQSRLPKAFATFTADSGKILHRFHAAVEARARENGVGIASLSTLKTQIHTYELLFSELTQELTTNMTELQREANRDFSPTIAQIMHTVYEACAEEHGKGSFARMKAHMSAHVERARHSMFNAATLTVKGHLDAMCRALRELMEQRADDIFLRMKADYMRALGGVQVGSAAVLPRAERVLRGDVMRLLNGVDARFETIAKGELGAGVTAADAPAVNDESDVESASAFDTPTAVTADAAIQNSIAQENDDSSVLGAEKQRSVPMPCSNEVSDGEW